MTGLKAFTGAITALGGQFDNVATDAGNVIDGASALSGVLSSHGTIGHPAAFATAIDARRGAVGAAKADSERLAQTLRQAANAYERGDLEAAERLKAQADRLGGAGEAGPATTAGGYDAGAAPDGGQDRGIQTGSQMMGQFSQMAGQMMQGITQPVQGIVQGLSQIPQQAMQGVQGIIQAATQGGAAGGTAASDLATKSGATNAGAPPTADGSSGGAGAPTDGEKAPAHAGIMSEERMRELQGLPPRTDESGGKETASAPSPRIHQRTARDL
ncbi:type VII secretion target [Mycolicibacterium sp. XJ775]